MTNRPKISEVVPYYDRSGLSAEEKADLIVLGSRGLSGIKAFLLGSVSDRVAHHAPCSVLIVR